MAYSTTSTLPIQMKTNYGRSYGRRRKRDDDDDDERKRKRRRKRRRVPKPRRGY